MISVRQSAIQYPENIVLQCLEPSVKMYAERFIFVKFVIVTTLKEVGINDIFILSFHTFCVTKLCSYQ